MVQPFCQSCGSETPNYHRQTTTPERSALVENEWERRCRSPDEGYIYVEAPGLGMS
jgi:hypothetical protein